MKKILSTLLFSSLCVFASAGLAQQALEKNKDVEPGYYTAINAEKGDIHVEMDVRQDGTAWVSLVTDSTFKPDVECEGNWSVQGNMFTGNLECDHFLVPFIDVNIDITTVTPESVRSENGAEVWVQLDIMGPEPRLFILKKIEQ